MIRAVTSHAGRPSRLELPPSREVRRDSTVYVPAMSGGQCRHCPVLNIDSPRRQITVGSSPLHAVSSAPDSPIRLEKGRVKAELCGDLAARTPITGVPPNVRNRICVVTRRIIERLFDPILTVDAALRRCGVTSHTFTAQFRRVHDRTPGRYIWHGRMRAARRCLQHPELEITIIAFSLGYERYRTFARAVKRYAGCSPSDWREELLGENVH